MTEIVVDTDVVSFVFKNHPIGKRYDFELAGRVPLISFMTVAELERWALQYRWSSQRLDWLHTYLRQFTVVPSSPDLCRGWGEVTVAAQAMVAESSAQTPGSPPRPFFIELRWLPIIATIISAYRG